MRSVDERPIQLFPAVFGVLAAGLLFAVIGFVLARDVRGLARQFFGAAPPAVRKAVGWWFFAVGGLLAVGCLLAIVVKAVRMAAG